MNNAFKILLLLGLLSNGLMGQNFFERYDFSTELMPLINTPESEISPAFVKGGLYFTAVREERNARERSRHRNVLFYDVFQTQTDMKGYPQNLGRLVNGFGNNYHEGPVSWCAATGELFVTQSSISGRDSLRRTVSREHVRLKIVVMKEVDEQWVFAEDLPFNRGEYHFAHPAISATGDTLVFSSDKAGGYGNSDLYMSVRINGQWGEPQNLGERINTAGNEMFPSFGPDGFLVFSSDGQTDNIGQLDLYYINLADDTPAVNLGENINSEYDDFGLVVHPSREYGYFSSNRPGAGSDDIYRVQFSSLYENIVGVVVNAKGEPVPEATVDLQDCDGTLLQSTNSGPGGRFSFEVYKGACYQAVASKPGYKTDLKSYHLEKSVRLSITQVIRYRIQAFDIETGDPIPGATVSCNEQQWVSDDNGVAEINTDNLNMCDLMVTGDEYFSFIIETGPYQFVPGADIVDTVRLFRKELNKAYLLENIVFFLDKWRLLPESEQELRKVIKLMKDNPSLKIELASHTDSRGEAQYNLWLSQKRSDSAADFLIENGIPKERIVSQGYGESRLINRCANGVPCSEEEHLENRRTEFIILEY